MVMMMLIFNNKEVFKIAQVLKCTMQILKIMLLASEVFF